MSDGRPKRHAGVTFTEILVAVLVMGLAMIPLFGVLTGGVLRSDVSVTYESAANIARSIMNTLLSEQASFDELVANIPAGAGAPHPGLPTTMPNLLGTDGTAPNKYFHVGRNNFKTELHVGSYPYTGATTLQFCYYANPQLNYEAHPAHTADFKGGPEGEFALAPGDLPAWSPYTANTTNNPNGWLSDKSPWATKVVSVGASDSRVTTATNVPALLKLVLFVKWGDEWQGKPGDTRGGIKQISLVSFKARL